MGAHLGARIGERARSGIGVSWQDADGAWHTLGELDATHIKKTLVKTIATAPDRVAFEVSYEGELFGVSRIIEHYVLTPQGVELTTEVPDYRGPLRYVWPVLADDGRTQDTIRVQGGVVSVSQGGTVQGGTVQGGTVQGGTVQGGAAQTFTARGAERVQVLPERGANHNGWARLAVAEYPRGGKITLWIAPQVAAKTQK